MQDQGHSKSRSSNVNVIEGQGYLRSRPLKVKVIQVQGDLMVTVILRSRSFWNQMVISLISIPKRVVGFRLNAYRYLFYHIFCII